ncbi:RRN3 family protein [Pleurotus pulmonarius]
MDPHSTLSQFNQRTPKVGPLSSKLRYTETPTKLLAEKRPNEKPVTMHSPFPLVRRPIATNSRVKQDEKYRKDMYLVFVNNALQQKAGGLNEPFGELVDQFNPKRAPSERAHLRSWLSALSHVVSRLDRSHSVLVEAIVNMPWTTFNSATVKSYTVFIGMLVSARPEYLSLVLGRIAQGFTHQSAIQTLDLSAAESSAEPLTRRTVYDRLHYLLRHLHSLIPTLSSTLQPLLVRNFPHKRQNLVTQTTYIRNLLHVASYCPEIGDKVMATIIDRAIQIDVEIQVELEELEEADIPQDTDIFEIDPFDTAVTQDQPDSDEDDDSEDDDDEALSDISSDGGDMDDSPQIVEIPTDARHIHAMVKKLDAILTLLFKHFEETVSPTPQLDSSLSPLPPLPSSPFLDAPSSPILDSLEPFQTPNTPAPAVPDTPSESNKTRQRTQFHTLLSIFDRTIIKTFKSRYTQFLLFWYSSLDPEYTDLFQGLLVSKALLEEDLPAVTRSAAASYIGSYISRAKFIDRDGARRVVNVLCDYVKSHLDRHDMLEQANAEMPSMAHHSVFYAVVQAIFLIFCFRWRDFLADVGEEDDLLGEVKPIKKWISTLDVVQRVVTSTLNPLKICSANVVMQFARVAQATGFVYCYSIMESNKRSEYSTNVNNTSTPATTRTLVNPLILDRSVNTELNTFFPFDPYRLPRSSPFIESVYREWSSVAIEDDDDDDDDDDDVEDEDEDGGYDSPAAGRDDRIGGHSVADSDAGGLGESFNAMSISPAQPRVKTS